MLGSVLAIDTQLHKPSHSQGWGSQASRQTLSDRVCEAGRPNFALVAPLLKEAVAGSKRVLLCAGRHEAYCVSREKSQQWASLRLPLLALLPETGLVQRKSDPRQPGLEREATGKGLRGGLALGLRKLCSGRRGVRSSFGGQGPSPSPQLLPLGLVTGSQVF